MSNDLNEELDAFAKRKFSTYLKPIHCQIDSNIHSEDYFYAKNCLQVPEYRNKISQFLVTLIRRHGAYHAAKENPASGLTLIGHKIYSELVLYEIWNTIQMELQSRVSYHIFSTNSFQEKSISGKVIFDNIILIMPLSATFSTSIRIKKELEVKQKVWLPILNIFLITDGDLNELKTKERHFLYRQFNWGNIDTVKREIHVLSHPAEGEDHGQILQRYLFPIHSKLLCNEDCTLCFPEQVNEDKDWLLNEVPLIELDTENNTPNIINYLPGDEIKPYRHEIIRPAKPIHFEITNNFLVYGHYKWLNRCFLYWFNVSVFLQKNEWPVITWLKELKQQYNNPSQEIDNSGVLLVTPAYYAKSPFIFLVNKWVFDDQATIIFYNNDERFIYESASIFTQNIRRASRIYYVDDVVDDEEFILQLNSYVLQYKTEYSSTHITSYGTQQSKMNVEKIHALDGVFSVINRCSSVSQLKIQLSLNHNSGLHYFFSLTVPPIKIAYIGCPLCKASRFYSSIINACSLDSIKLHFGWIKNKIRPQKMFSNDIEQHNNDYQTEKTVHKYDPFIKATINYLDEGNSTESEDALQKFKLRKENGFNRSLLKIVITHELFCILYDQEELKRTELANVSSWSKAKLKEKAIIVFENIYETIKKSILLDSAIFKEVANQDKKTFDSLFKNLLLKQLCYPPFCNHKLLQPLLFTYLLKLLNDLLQINPAEFFTHYKYFRRLRLYFKCSVMLNSNYIIRFDTISKLKIIFKEGNHIIEIRKNNFREKIDEYSKEAMKVKGIKKDFLLEVANIFKYKYNEIANFKYFIAGLIKQVVYGNEIKFNVLEKNLNRFKDDYKIIFKSDKEDRSIKNHDFFYLWRILKFENIGKWQKYLDYHFTLIKKGADFEKKCYAWDAELADYENLLNLHGDPTFINNSDFKDPAFMETLLLLSFLKLDNSQHNLAIGANKKEAESDKNKLAIILNKIILILGLKKEEEDFQISINVELSGDQQTDENLYTQIVCKDKMAPQYIKSPSRGFIKHFLDGLSMYSNDIPLTFTEVYKNNEGKYESMSNKYYTCKDSLIPESRAKQIDTQTEMDVTAEKPGLLPDKFNHHLFFRIANVSVSQNGLINNEGMAVIVVSNNLGGLWDPDKLRFLLLAREYLKHFITTQVQNDSFSQLRIKEAKFDSVTTMQHGLERYTSALEKLFNNRIKEKLKGSQDIILETSLLLMFLKNQLGNFFIFFGSKGSGQSLNGISTCSKKELKEHILKVTKIIFNSTSIPECYLKEGRDYTMDIHISGQPNYLAIPAAALYWVIIPEIIINIKKRYVPGIKQQKLRVNWNLSDKSIVIVNTIDDWNKEIFITKYPMPKPDGGIEMCSKILQSMNYKRIETSYDRDKSFITTINLELSDEYSNTGK